MIKIATRQATNLKTAMEKLLDLSLVFGLLAFKNIQIYLSKY